MENNTVTVELKYFMTLLRNDERLRIILDMLGKEKYLSRDDVLDICGIKDVDEEEEHE